MADLGSSPQKGFVDNPLAQTVYVTDCAGIWMHEGNLMLSFECATINHSTTPGAVTRTVVSRVVMPIPAAQRLVLGLNDFLEQRGLSPSLAAQAGHAPQ